MSSQLIVQSIKDIFTNPEVSRFLYVVWSLIKCWWWLVVPGFFLYWFLFMWRWWRFEDWYSKRKFPLLEVRIPKEVIRPLRAMEAVMAGFWATYGSPDWMERWIEGEETPYTISLEIASIGGEIHFYVRTPESRRDSIEAHIYAQYPDAEIEEVMDYTKNLPDDIPNKEWRVWGVEIEPVREDIYPFKTYPKFFEEQPQQMIEGKRIDPLAQLLEVMGKLRPSDEQIWLQILITPVTDTENDWKARGQKEVNRLVHRAEKKPVSIIGGIIDLVIRGKPPGGGEKEEETPVLPPEMKLTPGEKEIVASIENKIKKPGFRTVIRPLYIAKREIYNAAREKGILGFFGQFSTKNLNSLHPSESGGSAEFKPQGKITPAALKLIWKKRADYYRARKLLKAYKERRPYWFPRKPLLWTRKCNQQGTFILDTEELSTLYHFPGREMIPAPPVPRIEAKKGKAPPGIPTGS